MITALLSDIHGNLEALHACLRHAQESGADRYAFLGDLVGYGADPEAVIDVVRRHAQAGSVAVKGNHDAAIAQPSGYMNDAAAEAIDWTRGVLSADAKNFLASMPLCVRDETSCFVHASAARPERWDYVDSPAEAARSMIAAGTAYTFSGHVHDQALYFQLPTGKVGAFHPQPGSPVPVPSHRRWLALVGSVGQPRDGNPAAAYALFDPEARMLTFQRVPYDRAETARKIRAAGLPEMLAYRIGAGI